MAHGSDLRRRQHVQQSRAGNEPRVTARMREKPFQCVDVVVDDHRVVKQRHRSRDRRVMIKMNPALPERQPWCEPPLVGARPSAKINDLDDVARITGVVQIVDQGGKQGADGGGTSRGVGGYPSGEPAWVDDGSWRRAR